MTSKLNIRLVRFVKVLLDLILGLLIFASVILLLLILSAPIILNISDLHLTASVPVAIGVGESPEFSVEVAGSTEREVRAAVVDGAQGTLRLETSNPTFIIMSYSASLVTALGFAYLIYLVRLVLQTLIIGEIFSTENTRRIRRIGYLVLVVNLLRAAAQYFASEALLKQVAVITPQLSLPSPFDAEIILASLLILILAHVWSYGLELERDRALTI